MKPQDAAARIRAEGFRGRIVVGTIHILAPDGSQTESASIMLRDEQMDPLFTFHGASVGFALVRALTAVAVSRQPVTPAHDDEARLAAQAAKAEAELNQAVYGAGGVA